MKRISRTERTQRSKSQRARLAAIALAVVGVLGIAGTATALLLTQGGGQAEDPAAPVAQPAPSPSRVATGSADATAKPESIEVPDVVGRSLAEAVVMLEAAGLVVKLTEDPSALADAVGEARGVIAQEPAALQLVPAGTAIMVVVPAEAGALGGPAAGVLEGMVVCIDPGHQTRGDSQQEPIGPGAAETKPRVTGGTTGVTTRVPEYEVVLQISMNLKERLEAAGISVVMTRDTNDVSISNAERARMANAAGADLFVRVHADGSTDPNRAGITTLYPGTNQWTGPIAGRSERAARLVQDALVASTGAADLGIKPRTDLSGFNWATVPSVLIECGFMTNAIEDRLLSSPHYQDKLAEGMAAGIIAYLGE